MLTKRTDDGQTLYIDELQSDQGSKGAFYLVFESNEGDELWGYYCSNCNEFNAAEGPVWKLVCRSCGNRRQTV